VKQDIMLEVFYPHSPDRVWQALTDRHALTAWMMENDFEPQLGRKFQFRHSGLPGFDTFIHCEVIEIEPPKRLVYRWQDPQSRTSTIVQWTLTAAAEGTTLQLQHYQEIPVMAISPSAATQRLGDLYDSIPWGKEYESPMNMLTLGVLNDSPQTLQFQTLQFNESSASLITEPSLILQAEWHDRLVKLSQELSSSNTSDSMTESPKTSSLQYAEDKSLERS
jgi:uncharacterized protein YndB with AHSA1/START domain